MKKQRKKTKTPPGYTSMSVFYPKEWSKLLKTLAMQSGHMHINKYIVHLIFNSIEQNKEKLTDNYIQKYEQQ